MRKHVEESVATGAAAGRGRGGRFSAGRKREVVMRLLRGEDLESVSRAVGITAARASHWRAQFLAAGQAGLKSAEENEAVRRWRAAGVHYFQSQMTRALQLMGCDVPPRM